MRIYKSIIFLLLITLLLSACQSKWDDPKNEYWGDDAVFYQIFVRSFSDSDGDGVGDFNGLTAKLDYLNDGNPKTTNDLGVTGIWLMPIFPSPSYHGYDVTDYMTVNPLYGTLDDFKIFIAEAHKRGIRVIIDFVINHTSRQHPWFTAAEAGQAPYRDFYIWSDDDPGFVGPWNQDVWHESADGYYYGVFSSDMPDLNYRSPAVTAEIEKITRFWLTDVGIDGFRVDGAKHLIEEDRKQENTEATHAWLKQFQADNQSVRPDVLVVGEVWSSAEDSARYVNEGEFNLVFNFALAEDILAGVSGSNVSRIANSLATSARVFDPGKYAPFLSNHDQVRTMTRLNDNVAKARAAASILLTAPGTPFIYYGEEIGMTGNKPDPSLRTPMQWTPGENGGFTTGIPWNSLRLDYAEKNVELESADENSLLSHYRNLIRIRNNHIALRSGDIIQVYTGGSGLFSILRVAEQESVLVLVNITGDPIANPTLAWDASSLQDTQKPTLLMGKVKAAGFTPGERGSLKDFIPVPVVGPSETIIIQYRP